MKLTKKLEEELKLLYVLYFDSLFSANVENYKSYFTDDFKQIGTTLEEVWFSKNEAGKYLETHVEPVAGKIEFRNRDIRMEAVDKLILIIEQADCYVNIDHTWVYYDRVRVSSLLQKKNTDWKFVQQHISFPDCRTEEGQTVALEKIKAENIQLRDAVKRRTVELENINRDLEDAMLQLKSTQSQLIQSEKMASLGELTAGIAHEIQNPLNFVNNFSEVSVELVQEILAARIKKQESGGDLPTSRQVRKTRNENRDESEELEDELLGYIKQNLEKIHHHGKRADSIVKGMLEHSKKGSGEIEPTKINALADEYLRLAYHAFLSGRQGIQAKDKVFKAIPKTIRMKTDFDKTIDILNIIPQDIGRVFLNLFNNAFYAVNERTKKREEGYLPTILVSTKKEGNKVLISVKDNGSGIPDTIKDKIFQPFFTTKPTGQGTGLGLSLSYDIVKAHGGDLSVESEEGKGASFIISIPIKN